MSVSPQLRYVQSPEADATMAGDRAAIFHRGTQAAVTLNVTGTVLWNSLTSPQSGEELAMRLRDRYPAVAAEQVDRDVRAFLDEMLSHKLLQPVD